jgi:heat shock protein HslJ
MKENQEKKSIAIENTTWIWQYTIQDNLKVYPKEKDVFTITFDQGKLRISTDCNTMGGSYTITENNFDLGMLMSTKKYCKDSQESTFAGMLNNSKLIEWDDKELKLKSENEEIMIFVKK